MLALPLFVSLSQYSYIPDFFWNHLELDTSELHYINAFELLASCQKRRVTKLVIGGVRRGSYSPTARSKYLLEALLLRTSSENSLSR